MTPKEKAKELVNKLIYENKVTEYVERIEDGIVIRDYKPYQYYYSKKHALIAVDEIFYMLDNLLFLPKESIAYKYYLEVKQEINNL